MLRSSHQGATYQVLGFCCFETRCHSIVISLHVILLPWATGVKRLLSLFYRHHWLLYEAGLESLQSNMLTLEEREESSECLHVGAESWVAAGAT